MRIGELFSGYSGLGMGVQSVLGGEIAWHSEIDPGACKILAHRYPDVPNLGDITAVDWSRVEPVDVLTGGFPCQDVSAAGKRAGIKPGTRSGLWSEMHRAIVALRPSLVVIENVRGLLSAAAQHPAHGDVEPCPWCMGDDEPVSLRALGAVLGDLADAGFHARWVGVRASDIGAPHGRFRVFVAAWPAQDADVAARGERRVAAPRQAQGGRARANTGGRGGAPAADASGDGRHERPSEPAWLVGGSDAALGGDAAPDPDGDALREQPVGVPGRGSSTVARHAGADSAADPDSNGVVGSEGRREQVRADERVHADRCGPGPSPDAHGSGRGADLRYLRAGQPDVEWGAYGPAIRRWERLTRPAPAPTVQDWETWQRRRDAAIRIRRTRGMPVGMRGSVWNLWHPPAHRLSPDFVEWMQGLPVGWVTGVPGLTRNEALKALGNGVVPQQAAAALRLLLPDVARAAA